MVQPLFQDRMQAGRRLAMALGYLKTAHPLILALPRGGVPVAYEIARTLDSDMDLLFVRKIGAPGHEEFALGAVVDGATPQLVLNADVVRSLAPSPNYIQAEMRRQLQEIARRRRLYTGDRPAKPLTARTLVVVDDGIATGATVRAALRGIRKAHPAKIVLAVPVGPHDTIEQLRDECDEIVCLATPEPFVAVGLHYAHFDQTSDEEVILLLRHAEIAASNRRRIEGQDG